MRCGQRQGEEVRARRRGRARVDVTDLELEARDLAAYDVVLLAAAAGKAEGAVAHLRRHTAAGAVLVVDVEPEVGARAGLNVLAVCHPDGDAVTNSVIVVRKVADDELRRNRKTAAPHVVTSPSGSCTAKVTQRSHGGKGGGARKRPSRS